MKQISVILIEDWNGQKAGQRFPLMEAERADLLVRKGFAKYECGDREAAGEIAAKAYDNPKPMSVAAEEKKPAKKSKGGKK